MSSDLILHSTPGSAWSWSFLSQCRWREPVDSPRRKLLPLSAHIPQHHTPTKCLEHLRSTSMCSNSSQQFGGTAGIRSQLFWTRDPILFHLLKCTGSSKGFFAFQVDLFLNYQWWSYTNGFFSPFLFFQPGYNKGVHVREAAQCSACWRPQDIIWVSLRESAKERVTRIRLGVQFLHLFREVLSSEHLFLWLKHFHHQYLQ